MENKEPKQMQEAPINNTAEILKELSRIQSEINVPKSQKNTFGNYKYRSTEDILACYKKVKGDTSLVLRDEIAIHGDRIYIKAIATLFHSPSGTSVSTQAMAREPAVQRGMSEAQITGSTSSYARKYSLCGLFSIDDTKDPDTDEYAKQTKKTAPDFSMDEVLYKERTRLDKAIVICNEEKDEKRKEELVIKFKEVLQMSSLDPNEKKEYLDKLN